jgi:hypothetical protein
MTFYDKASREMLVDQISYLSASLLAARQTNPEGRDLRCSH